MINKAILLVGGRGTRLAELTKNTPKPMLKVAGAPVTEHQIVKAREAGRLCGELPKGERVGCWNGNRYQPIPITKEATGEFPLQ